VAEVEMMPVQQEAQVETVAVDKERFLVLPLEQPILAVAEAVEMVLAEMVTLDLMEQLQV
jgi:hypothetical protein